jgi:hypothetical protein
MSLNYFFLVKQQRLTKSRVAIGSMDPNPDSESGFGSGSRRTKTTYKSRKKFENFMY